MGRSVSDDVSLPSPSLPESTSSWPLPKLVAHLCLLKVLAWWLVVFVAHRSEVRQDYTDFLYLETGDLPEWRLSEVRRDFFLRLTPYDGQYYLDVAKNGYRRFGERERRVFPRVPQGNFAFFPLYPTLIQAASVLPWDVTITMFVLNGIFSVLGSLGLWKLAERFGLPAWPCVILIEAFPTSIFRTFLYTESLFLALSVWAFLFLLQRRFVGAALLGALCGMLRPQGILVAALLFPWSRKREDYTLRSLFPAFGPVLGLATFSLILYGQIGDPLGFISVQKDWGREASLGGGILDLFRNYDWPPFDRFGALFAIVLLPFGWKRLPLPLTIFAVASVALPFATGTLLSMGRFISVSFPHFLVAAFLLRDRPRTLVFVIAISLAWNALLLRALLEWRLVG
ncbi:MAG: hypothetical protein AAF517_21770 [Planctomycetota bacterium]